MGLFLHLEVVFTIAISPDAQRHASPAPKANEDLANATFNKAFAKAKNGSALGVSVNAIDTY